MAMAGSEALLSLLSLSFILTFILSVLNIIFSTYSRIGFSRLLDEKNPLKDEILDRYDEFRIAIEFGRIIFLLMFVMLLQRNWPLLNRKPLLFFLVIFTCYFLLFDYLPRLFLLVIKENHLKFFLPVLVPLKFLLFPFLIVPQIFLRREEERQAASRAHEASEEEIETFIDEATEEGIIEKDEDELLRGVVEFGDRQVREIMTPRSRMVTVSLDITVRELKEIFIREKYSRIPVYRDRLDNIVGMVMAKDLLEFADSTRSERKIDFLLRPALFVPETMPVKKLLSEFKKNRQKLAVVIDEYGGVSGLVTMEDVLEEIVGEIQDEYDTEEQQIVVEKPDTYLVRGETEVEELEEVLGCELSEENFQTVNGLLQQHLGRLPQPGEKLELANLEFEILEVDERTIQKVRLTRKPAESNQEGEE